MTANGVPAPDQTEGRRVCGGSAAPDGTVGRVRGRDAPPPPALSRTSFQKRPFPRGAGSNWRLTRIQCTGKDRIFDEGPLNTVVDAIPCLPRVAENLSRWITPAAHAAIAHGKPCHRAMDGTCISIGQTPHPETLFSACCIRRRPIACRDRFIYCFCHDRLLAWGATPAGISFWHRCA